MRQSDEPPRTDSTASRLRAAAWAALRVVRDAWLVLGLAVALFVGLEIAYRVQGWARRMISGSPPVPRLDPAHPYADSVWYGQFIRERNRFTFRWEPFVYFRGAPQRGRYINVDSAGLRVVPRFRIAGGRPLRVFLFGGSTTWGYFERDSSTRPALVARRLAAAGYDAEVVNYAQPAYTSVQELLTLILALRRGDVPDVVVFWDGVNDVSAMRSNGRPGLSYREFERADDALFNTQRRERGGRVDFGLALRSLAAPSELLSRLVDLTARPEPWLPATDPVPFCRQLMGDWLEGARFVDHLAKSYGFAALVVWQPQRQTLGRPLTAYERRAEAKTLHREEGLDAQRRECARVADSLVAARAAESIVNWARLHSDDTGTVYLDQYSHTTERATAIEADTLTKLLLVRLSQRSASLAREQAFRAASP